MCSTRPCLGSTPFHAAGVQAVINQLAAAEGACSESDAIAAYWRSVAERQAVELDQVNAAWLTLSQENQRLDARVQVQALELAALRMRVAIVAQQQDRSHEQ